MGVRWPILALVGVGRARTRPGKRFGTVVDGVVFVQQFSFLFFDHWKEHAFWGNHCGQNMISYLNLYEPKPSSKDLLDIQF